MDRLSRYRRLGHYTVDGWLLRPAVELITALGLDQTARGTRGAVAEIGVHHGRLFILLALLRQPGERAVGIDLYEHQELNLHSGRGDRARVARNIERHVGSDTGIVLVTADSSKLDGAAVREAAGGDVRLFSVDGGHTAELARHDMGTADEAIGDDGIIILDDYFNEAWPGVSTGVADLFLGDDPPDLAPFAIAGNKVFFSRPQMAAQHQATVRRVAAGAQWHCRERELLGAPVVHVAPRRRADRAKAQLAPVFRRGPGAVVKRAGRRVLSQLR